jgi:hypothetical protein
MYNLTSPPIELPTGPKLADVEMHVTKACHEGRQVEDL